MILKAILFSIAFILITDALPQNTAIDKHRIIHTNAEDLTKFTPEFELWKIEFNNKSYGNDRNEKQNRLLIFVNNLEEIKRLNKNYAPASFGLNEFADLTWDEFKVRLHSAAPSRFPKDWVGDLKERNVTKLTNINDLPKRYSWRNDGREMITPVKNQGRCSGGWAFATVAVAEAMLRKNGKGKFLFSEQQILDSTDEGCEGGRLRSAFGHFQDGGVPTIEEYPYRGVTGDLIEGKPLTKLGTMRDLPRDEYRLAYALKEGGPFAVTVKVGRSFQFYKSGTLSADDCENNETSWHSVMVTGYGNGYWEIKNSFGTSWGEQGFGKVKRNSNWCHIEDGPTTGWFF